jgi:hypothetical protein
MLKFQPFLKAFRSLPNPPFQGRAPKGAALWTPETSGAMVNGRVLLCEGCRVPAASSKIPADRRSLGRPLYHERTLTALPCSRRSPLPLARLPLNTGMLTASPRSRRSPLPLARLPLDTGTLTALPRSRGSPLPLARLPLNTGMLTASPRSRGRHCLWLGSP